MKKRFEKFAVLTLVIMLIACIAVAFVACDEKADRVTYKFNNGVQKDIETEIIDGAITKPKDPQPKENYTFYGWVLEGEDELFDFSRKVKGTVTLNAVWMPNVTFDESNVVFEFSGDRPTCVKEGQSVSFTVRVKDGFVGNPTIYANSEALSRQNGVYTYTVTQPTIFRADGLNSMYILEWVEGESFDFVFDTYMPSSAREGTNISFKLRKSVFYTGTPVVKANATVLVADGNGYYNFTVEGTTIVTVDGFRIDDTPMQGNGTLTNPYLISRPAHLKLIHDDINENEGVRYGSAYIKLAEDLDLEGETISPIGNYSDDVAYFNGDFDGNDHKISNFNLTYDADGVGYVSGLFAILAEGARIANLKLESDLTFEAESAQDYMVGALVGCNLGGVIENCSFNGSIEVTNDFCDVNADEDACLYYLGGLVGFHQGYLGGYVGSITYSSVDADIYATGQYDLFALGGIIGSAVGQEDGALSYIANCAFRGEIDGSILKAGGIVGYLRELSSVTNCLSEGSVHANGASYTVDYAPLVAAAGAIVGVADNETAVQYNYSIATLHTAQAVDVSQFATRQNGVIGAVLNEGSDGVDGRAAIDRGNIYGTALERNALLDQMGWIAAEWDDDMYPTLPTPGSINFTIRVNFSGKSVDGYDADETLHTLTEDTMTMDNAQLLFMLYGSDGYNEFVATDGTVSYGFFLDSAHETRLPAGTLLTRDLTIYVGFADYSGLTDKRYYGTITEMSNNLSGSATETDVEFIFGEDGVLGRLTVKVGPRVSHHMFVYDGESIILHDICLNQYLLSAENSQYWSEDDFIATFADGELIITDELFFESTPIKAYPETAVVGVWYGDDGTYTFEGTRKGSFENRSGSKTSLTYTTSISGENISVTITRGSTRLEGLYNSESGQITLDDNRVLLKKSDEYRGKWESNYNNRITIEFDGKGKVVFDGHEYSYSIDEDSRDLHFEDITARFNSDNLLELINDGVVTVFGMEGSLIGVWRDTSSSLGYEISMTGITRYGYGYAHDSNGSELTYGYEGVTYTNNGAVLDVCNFYLSDGYYAEAYLLPGNSNYPELMGLPALAVSLNFGEFQYDTFTLTLEDPLAGKWNGTDGSELEFNGDGIYYIDGIYDGSRWNVTGLVDIVDSEGKTDTYIYKYDMETKTAVFPYYKDESLRPTGEKQYNLVFEGEEVKVNGTVVYKHPDIISTYMFYAEDLVFNFNGKSNLNTDGLAKVTVTDGEGHTEEYDYTSTRYDATLTRNGDEVYRFEYAETGGNPSYTLIEKASGKRTPVGIYSALMGKKYLVGLGTYLDLSNKLDFNGMAAARLYDDMHTDIRFEAVYISDKIVGLYIDGYLSLLVQYHDDNTIVIFNNSLTAIGTGSIEDGHAGSYTANGANDENIVGIELNGKGLDGMYLGTARFTSVDGTTWYLAYKLQGDKIIVGEVYEDGNGNNQIATVIFEIYFIEKDGAMVFEAEDGTKLYVLAK